MGVWDFLLLEMVLGSRQQCLVFGAWVENNRGGKGWHLQKIPCVWCLLYHAKDGMSL